MALFAEDIPESDGASGEVEIDPGPAFLPDLKLWDCRAAGWLMPERSPFTSAANTGTPIRLKASAITCRVTVLPVPVAPAIRPWRFDIPGSR